METQPECMLCFLKQALLTAQKVTDDPDRIFQIVQEVSRLLPDFSQQMTPAEVATLVNHATIERLGVADPFRIEKERYNSLALQVYPYLKEYVNQATDPLAAAIRVAALGNALDLSVLEQIDFDNLMTSLPDARLAIDHVDHFRQDVSTAYSILYLGDNAGEIVFDRILVEALPEAIVTFAVKSGPVVNDVTYKDATQSGMDQVTRIIETGVNYAGVPLQLCSNEFRANFASADVIISKGQANFETLSRVDANIYFLLKTKCGCVARELGVQQGDLLLKAKRIQS